MTTRSESARKPARPAATKAATKVPAATPTPARKAPILTPQLKGKIHQMMICSRVMDEVTIKMNRAGQGFFWIGGPGEEGFGVPLGLLMQKGEGPAFDYLHPHYRSNPILVGMGVHSIDTIRQMRSTATDPYSGGRNFVNHYAIKAWNVMPVTPTIETQYLQAPGTAWVQRRHGGTGITVVNGGDAGASEGDFACCLNWVSRPGREVPILIIINHNGFGISTSCDEVQNSRDLAARAIPYGIKTAHVDGTDVLATWQAIFDAMAYCRTERKPFVMQANVSRLYGHSSASGANRVEGTDPIERFEAHLIEEGLMTRAACDAVWQKTRDRLRDELKEVMKEPLAPGSDRDRFTFYDGTDTPPECEAVKAEKQGGR